MSLAGTALAITLQASSCFTQPIDVTFAQAHSQNTRIEQLKLIGIARDPENSELRYCEQHWLTEGNEDQPQQVRIDYFTPSGERFALKRLTSTDSRYHYDVLQQQLVSGETQSVTRLAASPEHPAYLRLKYQSRHNARRRQKTLRLESVDIVDSGLHFWIQDHWHQLEQGQRLQATLVSPRHLLAAKANIERRGCSFTDAIPTARRTSEHCMSIAPSNFLLRWSVPALRLGYDAKRRLRDYLGLTNISTDGSNRAVYVQYFHGPDKRE